MYIFIYEMLCNWLLKKEVLTMSKQLTAFNEIIEVVLKHEGGYISYRLLEKS